jgi:hypothetical protein
MNAGPTSSTLLSRHQLVRIPPVFLRELDYRWGTKGCWEWRGRLSSGYGRVNYRRVPDNTEFSTTAHRLSYLVLVGDIKPGLTLDHLCRNRSCWRPDHLEPVTPRANTLRGESISAKNAAKTHCHAGHLLTAENLRPDLAVKGWRGCLECNREQGRQRNALLIEARLALGMTWSEYIAAYGRSMSVAKTVLTRRFG